MRWIVAVMTFVGLSSGWAQEFSSWKQYTKGELISETTAFAPGSVGTVGLNIELVDKWHTYWVNPGDSGAPLRLNFKNSEGIKVQAVHMPIPWRIDVGPLISFAYKKHVLFPIEISVDSALRAGDKARLEFEAEWLVCDDVCIPAVQTFTMEMPIEDLANVKPSPHFELFQKTRAQMPVKAKTPLNVEQQENTVRIVVPSDVVKNGRFQDFLPFRGSGYENSRPKVIKNNPLTLELKKSNVPVKEGVGAGVLLLREGSQTRAVQFGDPKWTFEQIPNVHWLSKSFLWMLLSAFLGGLILNLMPCVFPILSLKLLSLLQIAGSKPKQVREQNLAYVAGVLVSFLFIALLLAGLRSAGHWVGWGFQLQSPTFLALLSWTFVALSLNLLGFYEIDILDAGFGQKLTRKEGLSGSFFTGVLAVVVASPCTAPFMGVALGFGISQPIPILVAVFFALGLGLAFPYLVFAIFPKWIRVLPKPGAWMMRAKQIMAIPLILTVVWLLWVLQQVSGNTALVLVVVSCVMFALASLIPETTKKKKWRKRAMVISTFFFAVVVLPYVRAAKTSSTESTKTEGWESYSPALLESLKGKRVFVNMTADWCLTCKVNERLVFKDSEILELLRAKQVTLVLGDWTQRDDEITMFLSRYDRVGVPFYVLFSPQYPEGQVLPEVLTKSSFKNWVEKVFPN